MTGATCGSPSRPGSGWGRPGPATSSRSSPTTAPSTPWATSPPALGSSSVACRIAVSRRTRRRRWWSRRRAGRSRRARALRARAAGVAAGAAGPAVRPVSGGERRHVDSRADSRPDSREGSRQGASGHARGGRTSGGRGRPASSHAARPQPEPSQTTAPHDELVSVVRGLVEAAPKRSVSIDTVANALKSRGFQRSPGSPRLVTRLRRIKELLVSPSGTITLAEDGAPPASDPPADSKPGAGVAPMVARPTGEAVEVGEPMAGRVGSRGRGPRPARDRDETDDDRQPDFLRWPDSEPEVPEIDGNRAVPGSRRPVRRSGSHRRPAPPPSALARRSTPAGSGVPPRLIRPRARRPARAAFLRPRDLTRLSHARRA